MHLASGEPTAAFEQRHKDIADFRKTLASPIWVVTGSPSGCADRHRDRLVPPPHRLIIGVASAYTGLLRGFGRPRLGLGGRPRRRLPARAVRAGRRVPGLLAQHRRAAAPPLGALIDPETRSGRHRWPARAGASRPPRRSIARPPV